MTRRKKIILFLAAAAVFLALALTVWFPGRTPPVKGLSSQDIREIRRRVRVEVWNRHVPPWRQLHLKYLARDLRGALLTVVEPPQQWDNVSGQHAQIDGQSTEYPDDSWLVLTTDGEAYLLQKIGGHWWLNGQR